MTVKECAFFPLKSVWICWTKERQDEALVILLENLFGLENTHSCSIALRISVTHVYMMKIFELFLKKLPPLKALGIWKDFLVYDSILRQVKRVIARVLAKSCDKYDSKLFVLSPDQIVRKVVKHYWYESLVDWTI